MHDDPAASSGRQSSADSNDSRPHPAPTPLAGVKHIETIARAAIFSDGCALLCRNRKHGFSYLPGGHVEPGEAATAAAERELVEEAGVTIRATTLGLIAESRFVQQGKPKHEITLVFHVEHSLSAAEPVPSREDYIEFWWAELAELVECDLRPASAKAWLMTLDQSAQEAPAWVSECITA